VLTNVNVIDDVRQLSYPPKAKAMTQPLQWIDCVNCDRKLNIFGILTDSEFEIISKNKYQVKFNPGEIIIKQGGSLTHVVCLTSGMAKIYIEGINRKNLILKILKSAEIVGGPGMFVDFRHYYSVAALEESTACFIEMSAFREALALNTQFATEFMGHLNIMSINLYNKLISLTQKQMPGRMADTLLYLARDVHQSNAFNTSLSRQDMAELAAMTKESAIRILRQFEQEELIKFDGRQFQILDDKKLIKISETG
jgi:CRP/FNR family transcriptional regulator